MEYSPDEYTRHYIVTALFKLMHEYEYEKIKVTDIVAKAGVGRATFYRYFKSKEDVIIYYFVRSTREFVSGQRIFPRCKEDHVVIATDTLTMFKQNKEPLKLLKRAHLTDLYLDYLNKRFAQNFERDNNDKNRYLPYLYAGMLYNVSMKWLEDDCKEDAQTLAAMIVEAIYDKGDKE